MRRSALRSPLLRALVAVLVAASLWAVPPHGAVQAAARDAEFVRLSGPTRYTTAVQIAEAYIDDVNERSTAPRIDTVIMSSGLDSHLGWAVPAPMLSKLYRAPLVLTRPDDVPVQVERLLTEQAIDRVILLGATSVISADVERELHELGVQQVERLGTDDVHTHAVAIAESLELPVGEFGARGRTVLLASADKLADALAAGPMSYAGDYPILLTSEGRLHPAVFQHLVASDVEHIIILGGTAAVGASVQQQLSGLEFTIARIAGPDRYGTAVELAEAMLTGGGLRPCFDGAELGLASGELSLDAITSGPLLGEQCAPLLLVPNASLPRTVASFLRSDTWVTGNDRGELSFTVFGGTAAVPEDVVTEVLERATTLIPIGGRISFVLDPITRETDRFFVSFGADIDRDKIVEAFRAGMFRVDYERIFDAAGEQCTSRPDDLLCANVRVLSNRVTVDNLSRPLRAEDENLVAVASGHRIGADDSRRPTASFSAVVRQPVEPVDRTAPEVRIIAPAGASSFAVLVIEEHPLDAGALSSTQLIERITVVAADGTPKAIASVSEPTSVAAGARKRHQRYEVQLAAGGVLTPAGVVGQTGGDAITVARNAFYDEGGRTNAPVRHVVRPYNTDFSIESITVGDVDPNSLASVTLNAGTQPADNPGGTLTIAARRDGIASGGRGNDWRIHGLGLPPPDPGQQPADPPADDETEPEIDVTVNPTIRFIRYRILAGEPTFRDLALALNADPLFAANFTAEPRDVPDDSPSIGGTQVAGLRLTGGGAAVGVRVHFSDPVATIAGLAGFDDDCTSPGATERIRLLREIALGLGANDDCALYFTAPDLVAYMTLSSSSRTRLPGPGDLVFVNGGAATSSGGAGNVVQGWLKIRYDAEVPSAVVN